MNIQELNTLISKGKIMGIKMPKKMTKTERKMFKEMAMVAELTNANNEKEEEK